jgi:hypothetical protein
MDTTLLSTHTTGKRKNPYRDRKKNKWAKFTYIGKETKYITKLFRDSPIQISYTTNNTIGKILSTKKKPHPYTRPVPQQRYIPTHMPRLWYEVHRPDRTPIPHTLSRALPGFQI